MQHLKWIEVDLAAIRSNLRRVLSRLNPGVRLMAVVKADAYGHGMSAARELEKAGAASLGVLNIAEAANLRKAGVKIPIQLLSPILPENARDVVRLGLIPTLDDLKQAGALNKAAGGRKIPVHLDLDYGLGRWGIAPKNLEAFLPGLRRLKNLRLAGLSTHIDYVPGKNSVEAEEKLNAFNIIAQRLKRQAPGLICHAANSSVLMDFPHWQMGQVRAGNLLYGINTACSKSAPLKNPWRFKARIIALHDVAGGRSIGYASEYIAPRAMRVATLPVGYADGLTMEPAERLIGFGPGFQYWGRIGATKAPFIGRCGISHVLVDVTDAPKAKIGDVVALPIRRTAASSLLPRVYI
ncbi:MAG: alanine racemase [Elusimicrobia bacterium RIFCSPHIGHO2_02_FULL_57_9]|nr:MAG: alanine racemase [Elusimicrobia bacterium RIFCSPHIGHO2_02_FULL_57_9]